MDFKVTGTRDGITALQMDIKVQGINEAIIRDGLKQALAARLEILDKMTEVMPEAREEMSDFAPRITTIKINPEKIREIIGKGGSMIRKIQEETETEINVEDDGTVEIAAVSGENVAQGDPLDREPDPRGRGRLAVPRQGHPDHGLRRFVEILPGKEGLVRIGELADYHVPDRRGRRVRRRRGHGRRDRDRPPGPGQPLAARPRCSATWPRTGRLGSSRPRAARRAHRRLFDSGLDRRVVRPVRRAERGSGRGPLLYSGRARPCDSSERSHALP